MAKYLALFLVSSLAMLILPFVLVQQLGWPGLLVYLFILVLLGAIAKRLVVKGLQRAILAPFMAKSAVLRNAGVRVHSITPAPRPHKPHEFIAGDGHEEWEDVGDATQLREYENCDFYFIDVTITPQSGAGSTFQLWEPGELLLVSGDTRSITPGDDDDNDFGLVDDVMVWQNGDWTIDEIGKYEGPQRVRLHAGVPPNADSARLRYYFEVFGEVRFPASRQYDVFDSVQ